MFAPLRAYFSPRFFGLDHIEPDKPALYVGNHPLFAIDYPLMASEIYAKKGILLRPLGDHWHFKIPVWGKLITDIGGVDGNPESCSKLMQAGEHIVVFPGGGREAFKRKGEAYQLIWKKRMGFARIAIQHGYPIVPFASKGADHIYSILLDGKDLMASPLGRLFDRTGITAFLRGGDMIPPMVRGIGPTLIPRPERFYFAFGEPIDTKRFDGRHEDPECLQTLRKEVEDALLTQIRILLFILDQDKTQSYWRRLLNRL
jgi:1-acyl-sn-glycerol-3-phosphate acyltransferase